MKRYRNETNIHKLMPSHSIPLLEIKDLNLSINGQKILNHINLPLKHQQIMVISGVSGSGKSLLIQSILGLLPHNAKLTGDIFYCGELINQNNLPTLRGKKIAYIPQFINALDPLMKVGKQVQGLNGTSEQLQEIFNRYHLEHQVRYLYPFQLSGGMARRVLLASALIDNAELILADEPTTGLNKQLTDEMISHFKQLKQAGKSIILITHDMDIAYQLADSIALFTQGHITQVIDNKPSSVAPIEPIIVKDKVLSSPLNINTLQVKALSFHYPQINNLFSHLNLTFSSSEITGIMSPSGTGKSTLAKLLSGFISPISGGILLNNQKINRQHGNPVQLISQHAEFAVNPYWTIKKILLESGQEDRSLWQQLGIDESWLARLPNELSGGELQRVCIARALAYPYTRFLIADEITSQLDQMAQSKLWNIILSIANKKNIGLIIISHNVQLIQQLCDRIIEQKDLFNTP